MKQPKGPYGPPKQATHREAEKSLPKFDRYKRISGYPVLKWLRLSGTEDEHEWVEETLRSIAFSLGMKLVEIRPDYALGAVSLYPMP